MVTMDNLRLHDPFLLTRFALENNLTNEPIIHQAYKVSRFMKTIKFGVEVPQSTKKAFEMDQVEGNNLWRESMQIEIDQLHAHETFIALEEH